MSASLIEQCPKFATCNAPICPLDDHWRNSRHLSGEAVCLYLRELSKIGGKERLAPPTLLGDLYQPIAEAHLELMSGQRIAPGNGFGIIREVLRRSAKSGSKLDSGRRLREVA